MKKGKDLPQRYYLSHFTSMLNGVRIKSAHLLDDTEQAFIRSFEALDENAQSLYVRLINRKPRWFRCSRLSYPEIDIPTALDSLTKAGLAAFAGTGQFASTEQIDEALLAVFPWHERRNLFRDFLDSTGENICPISLNARPDEVFALLARDGGLVAKLHDDTCSFLQFLFFENLHDDHTAFVLRDMGLRTYREIDDCGFTSRYASRNEARLAYQLAAGRGELSSGLNPDDERVQRLLLLLEEARDIESVEIEANRSARALGLFLERAGRFDLALRVYSVGSSPEVLERRIRVLHRLGRTADVLRLCEEILAGDARGELAEFASGMIGRIQHRTRRYRKTELQLTSESIELPAVWRGSVENGVCRYFEDQGFKSWFCENTPWNSLFGLLFWDILHDSSLERPVSPFHIAPADLRTKDFFERRRARFLERLHLLSSPDELVAELRRAVNIHYGVVNTFVGWHEKTFEECSLFFTLIGPEVLRNALLTMARDPVRLRAGFPDLLLWSETAVFLCEVKSENDQLSFKQYGWIERLRAWGVDVRVMNVKWTHGECVTQDAGEPTDL